MSDHDSSFFKTFAGVLGGLMVLAIIIFFVAQYVIDKSGIMNSTETQEIRDAAIAKRIAPEGKVRMMGDAEIASGGAGGAAAAPKSAKEIVTATCAGCHGAGVLGAPKIGDHDAWAARYAGGLDALVHSAIAGKGAMPPRGGNANLSDDEVRAAIEEMLSESGFDIAVTDLTAAAAPAEAPAAETSAADAAGDAVAAVVETVSDAAGSAMDAATSTAGAVADAVSDAASSAADAVSAAVAPADNAAGEKVYKMACVACHSVGVAGAPRFGDQAAWAPRIAQGLDTLDKHALQGFRGMPPKGGRMDLSDDDVKAAVAYMVAHAQ